MTLHCFWPGDGFVGELNKTPLYELHQELGARLVDFAGWSMPVQYQKGLIQEHLWCRSDAALFDVSHMTQVVVRGPNAAELCEKIVPGNIVGLAENSARYTMLTNERGGVIDDIIVTRTGDGLFIVANASRHAQDMPVVRQCFSNSCDIEEIQDHALVALQGPKAAEVLGRMQPNVTALRFMQSQIMSLGGIECRVSRLGYTGEDGFEISLKSDHAAKFARTLLAASEVEPAGLGARDSLRMEAGLCLYGQELDENTTPIEAGLNWTIGKRRREQGGFPGADTILAQLQGGAKRRLVGILPEGRAPARAKTLIEDADGNTIGAVTSGGFSPTGDRPISIGYVNISHCEAGSAVNLKVRGKALPASVAPMPFVPHRYARG